jgi:hypothetical protein
LNCHAGRIQQAEFTVGIQTDQLTIKIKFYFKKRKRITSNVVAEKGLTELMNID